MAYHLDMAHPTLPQVSRPVLRREFAAVPTKHESDVSSVGGGEGLGPYQQVESAVLDDASRCQDKT